MPNWVKNKVILGSRTKVERIITKYSAEEDGERYLDFNKILPMPEDLRIEYSSKSNDGLYIFYINQEDSVKEFLNGTLFINDAWKQENMEEVAAHMQEILNHYSNETNESLYRLGEKQYNNIKKYGHINWYPWALENWGTKWNSSNLRIDEEGKSFSFETAWDPAIPVLLKLSELEPDIKFAVIYADECIGVYTGYVLFKNGKIDFKGSFEDHSINAKKLACDCWEVDLDDLDDLD